MKDKALTELSDAEFKALHSKVSEESSRRAKIEREEREARHEDHVAKVKDFLAEHPRAIDIFRPKHDRANCSDEKSVNGLDADEDHSCVRCSLLDLKLESSWPEMPDGKWVRLIISDLE